MRVSCWGRLLPGARPVKTAEPLCDAVETTWRWQAGHHPWCSRAAAGIARPACEGRRGTRTLDWEAGCRIQKCLNGHN